MSDTIGRIVVPSPTPSGLTFPLISDYGYSVERQAPVIEHRFGGDATLAAQRFFTMLGPRRFKFQKSSLSFADRKTLINFYNATQGSYSSFTYNAPNAGGNGTTAYNSVFETAPLSITDLASMCRTGTSFLEIIDPASAPLYTVASTSLRFPSAPLASALLSQVQQIVPLIHIKVRNAAVPDIYLSDRRCTVNNFPNTTSGQLFLPRVLSIGEEGGDVLLSQTLSTERGSADRVSFTFGNADRAMSQLAQDCGLKYAQIDLSLFHVGTGILLQLWSGTILNWTNDGSPRFTVSCSDGLYPVTQNYPRRVISRQCWKDFDDGVNCPYSSVGSGGDPTKCDFFFNSPNGCLAHGMSPYFGGHPAFPQSVVIKDNGTGIIAGIARSVVTSTSIVSDSMYGKPLSEIWCNDGGNPQNAFWANAVVAAVRDESSFEDVLGVVGVGPIGGYEGMSVQTNADGFKFLVCPLADGFPPQGFKVDGQLNITGFSPALGLREILGADPNPVWAGRCNSGAAVPFSSTSSLSSTEALLIALGLGAVGAVFDLAGWITGLFASSPSSYLIEITSTSGTTFAGLTVGSQIYLVNSSTLIGGGVPVSVAFIVDATHAYVVVGWLQAPILAGRTGLAWGTAPTVFSLGQGTPQIWDVPDSTYSNILTGVAHDVLPFAAGTAFVEMRYAKSPGTGIAPTTAESHTMTVPIAKGLTGVTYDAADSQSVVAGLTNPFWIAVNCYFRALGLDKASSDAQLAAFIRSSVFKGDGSGCAEIADLSVPVVVGTGTETQFQFQGQLADFKPFRDWLQEILNCALGYFVFEFGALRLGVRENASSVSSFGVGNMLYQSLSISPADAAFEYLKVNFADRALQYQDNFGEYQDKDHASYMGRAGVPLTSAIRIVGLSSLSQSLRVAVSRVREEIGGILRPDYTANPYIEWDNANVITFRTTILGLTVGVGDVIGVTHPDIQTYPGPVGGSSFPAHTWNFRITKLSVHKDWSVTVTARSVTDSMYDLTVGPKPVDSLPTPPPVLFYPEPLGQWAPYEAQADAADALFPSEWTFGLAQNYLTLADGVKATAIATTKMPVNQFISGCGAVGLKQGSLAQATTGGSLKGNRTYYVQVCGVNATGQRTPPSDVIVVQAPGGTNTNTFTLNGIQWPPVDTLTGYIVFAAESYEDLICGQQAGALTGSSTTGYSPTSITVNGPFARSTYGIPNPNIALVRLKGRRLIHGGVLGSPIDSVATNHIVAAQTIDVTAADNWTGRVLAIIGRSTGNGVAPFAAFNVTAFNHATGNFTLDRDPVAAGVLAGDVFVVCFLGYDNSATPTVFTDAGLINAPNGHTGETVNDPNRIGNAVLVIKGTSRGQWGKIVSNTATSYTLDRPIVIDATSVWVVVTAAWETSSDAPVSNSDPNASTQISMEVPNYDGLPMLIGGVTVDGDNNEVGDTNAPVRMLYIGGYLAAATAPPQVGSITATPSYSLNGNVTEVSIDGAISLPTSDPNFGLIDSLQIDGFAPGSTVPVPLQTITGIQSVVGASVSYSTSSPFPAPLTDEPGWTVHVTSVASDGTTSAPAISGGFAVNSISVFSCTAVEQSRYIDPTDLSTHVIVAVTPIPNHSGIPFVATSWFFFRRNSGTAPAYYWINWESYGPGGTSTSLIDILLCGGPSISFQAAMLQGAWPGDFNAMDSATFAATYPTAVHSLPFGLVIDPPIANGISFTVKNSAGLTPTPANIYAGVNSLGNPYAGVLINSTGPLNGDPNCWFYQAVLLWGSYDGVTFTPGVPGGTANPASFQLGAQCDNDGTTQSWSSQGLGPGLYINYPSPNAVSSAGLPVEWIKITWYGLNRNSTNGATPWDGSDSNTTLQSAVFYLHVGQGAVQTSTANMVANPFAPTTGTNSGLIGWAPNASAANFSVNSNGQLVVFQSGGIQEQNKHACKAGQSFTLEFGLAMDSAKPGAVTAYIVFMDKTGGLSPSASPAPTAGTYPTFENNFFTATAPAGAVAVYCSFGFTGDTSSGKNWYADNIVLVQQVPLAGATTYNPAGRLTINTGNGVDQGSGALTTKNGPGITFDGSGNNVPNVGTSNTTLYIDGSGHMQFANLQTLSSFPSLPSASYPPGSAVLLAVSTTDPVTGHTNPADTVYRVVSSGLHWTASNTPADLVVGAIATGVTLAANQISVGTLNAGVVYAGQINTNQLNAGTISAAISLTSPTIQVTSGSLVVNIDATNYIKVTDSLASAYSQMQPGGSIISSWNSGNGYAILGVSGGPSALGYGELILFGNNFGNLLKITPQTSSVALAGSSPLLPANPAGYIVGTKNGTTIHIPYYN